MVEFLYGLVLGIVLTILVIRSQFDVRWKLPTKFECSICNKFSLSTNSEDPVMLDYFMQSLEKHKETHSDRL